MLATQGWQKLVDDKDNLDAVDRLVTQFSVPLEEAGVQLEDIHTEFENLLEYSAQYLSLSTLPYRVTWWRIFHVPCASCPSILACVWSFLSVQRETPAE